MNWNHACHNCEKRQYAKNAHSIAEYKYQNKLLFTANAGNIDQDDYKYTATFNKNKSQVSYFFTSKDIFFKWEGNNEGDNAIELTIKNGINLVGKANYKPAKATDA